MVQASCWVVWVVVPVLARRRVCVGAWGASCHNLPAASGPAMGGLSKEGV